MAAHKIRVILDPQTGESPWSFLVRREPDAVVGQVEVTVVDETTGIQYGPMVLQSAGTDPDLPPPPDPEPPPEPEPGITSHTLRLSAQPRVPGGNDYSIDVNLLDDADLGVEGVVVTLTVTGGKFGPGTTTETRVTNAAGLVRINWEGGADGDSLTASAPNAEPAEYVHTSVVVPPPVIVVPPPATGNTAILTPAGLEAVVGRLIARSATSGPVAALDARFSANEDAAYQNAVALADKNALNMANHYDALLGRFQRAIRDGDPTGPLYQRGREIVLRYLAWSKSAGFKVPPHNNTGMLGIEVLATLEGNADAITHIHMVAGFASGPDKNGYAKGLNANSDARQVAVALQAQMAATRLGIPYRGHASDANSTPDASLGSWVEAGQRQIGWVAANYVRADGSVPSNAHSGQCGRPECEAFFMNAMLANELLRWCRDTSQDPAVLELAGRIVAHLADEWARIGGPLGYLTGRAPGSANDLAGFYVWSGLVMWQESGETRFRDFALAHMQAVAGAGNAKLAKQWQESVSTHAQEAEALLAGVNWR